MYKEFKNASLFMITFIMILLALLPLLSTIESGFESTEYYSENTLQTTKL